MRTLVETGVLVGTRRLSPGTSPSRESGAGDGAGRAGSAHRPLPPEEKRLLQTAAVIGTDVPLALLQAIADVPEAALHRGLAQLRPQSSCTRRACFPSAPTPSSMP